MQKIMYEIKNSKGRTLCFQYAQNETQAVDFARMYGHSRAAFAKEYV